MDRRFISVMWVGIAAGCTPGDVVIETELPAPNVDNVAREALPPLCETTQGRALSHPAARGCSALDVVQDRELHLAPVRSALGEARGEVGRARELLDAAATLASVQALVDRAAIGRACDAAQSLGDAARQATVATAQIDGALANLARPRQSSTEKYRGDFGGRDERFVALRIARRHTIEAGAATQGAAGLFEEVCRTQTGPSRLRAQVARVDDAAQRVILADGRVFGLPDRAGETIDIVAGGMIEFDVYQYGDNTGLGDSVGGGSDIPAGLPDDCLRLAIAPIQSGPALGPATGRAGLPASPGAAWGYALTPIDGYQHDGRARLEAGMRLAVTPKLCATTAFDTPYDNHRITAKIEWVPDAGAKKTLAQQLDVEGNAVLVPTTANPTLFGKIRVTTMAQECHFQQPPPCNGNSCPIYPSWNDLVGVPPCADPVAITTQDYPVSIAPSGSFCTTKYDRTTFELEDDVLTEHQPAKIVNVVTSQPFGGTATFHANAFADAAPQPQAGGLRPKTTAIEVNANQPFGVFTFEPCMTNAHGVGGCNAPGAGMKSLWLATSSALVRFPRVVGTNPSTNAVWAYSCKLDPATVVRDRLKTCAGTDEFYRLPFEPGSDAREVSQGNCGSWTHACGKAQEFAYDFVEPEGEPIRAARGGIVVDVLNDQTENCFGDDDWCPGNHAVIRQQDGRYSFYTHMPAGHVYVGVGQRVFRGQQISIVGNTGNSSGAHLHFHVTDDSDGYSQTYVAKFEYFADAPSSQFTSCAIPPESNDDMGSNNYAPLYLP